MRTFDDTGKAFLTNYIGSEYTDRLSSIEERQAVFYGKASSCENPVLIRLNDRDKFIEAFREKFPTPEIIPENEDVNSIDDNFEVERRADKAEGDDPLNQDNLDDDLPF